ncbi:unnamed protein product [Bursaphelenchus okinawaensis]|uniref:Uncharacterized protein n=1 Tax=Bursaphelenchus okinawaensis TaxID=465554 RepID=A0A811JRX9_9BILA|nr:unnamed protein product [Bursaphelenchus okinawaensis]CAG9080204.1 unnamed protein product [Bursaphelenchus okinawaensis]
MATKCYFSNSMPSRSALKKDSTIQEKVRRCTTVEGILNVLNIRHQGSDAACAGLEMFSTMEFLKLNPMELKELEFTDGDIDKIMRATTCDATPKLQPRLAVCPQRRLSFAESLTTVHQISPTASSASLSSSNFSLSNGSADNRFNSMLNATPIRRTSRDDKDNVSSFRRDPEPTSPKPKVRVQNLIQFFNKADAKPIYPSQDRRRSFSRISSFSHTHVGSKWAREEN